MADYNAIAASAPNLTADAAEFSGIGNFAYEGNTTQVTVNGTMPSFTQIRNWGTEQGRFIDEADVGGRSRVVVLGRTAADDLFPADDPIDKIVKINNIPFRVIGVMQGKGSSFLGDQDATSFVPLTTVQERLFQKQAQAKSGERIVSAIYLQVNSEQTRAETQQSIKELLRERHRLQEGDSDDFTMTSQTELINSFGAVTGVLTIFSVPLPAFHCWSGGLAS